MSAANLSVPAVGCDSIGQFLAPLRQRPFGRLLTAYTVNQIGDYVGVVALAILVYAKTRDPVAVSGLYFSMQLLPAILAPLLTARLDQHALRSSLAGLYLCEALLFAGLAGLAQGFVLWIVLVLTLADGVLMLTARGLLRSAIGDVLEPAGLLRGGNGLVNVGFALGFVGGAALGGVLVDAFSVTAALLIDAGSFALCSVSLATASGLPAARGERVRFVERLREGFAYASSHPSVRLLLAGEGMAIVFFTLVVPIEVVYAMETIGTGDVGYGILIASWGLGVVLGSGIFLGATRRSPRSLILFSTAAIGVAYVGMGSVRVLWAACAFSILGGVGNGVQWVSVMTAIQESTPADLQARITGLLEAVASAATGIGFMVGGLLTAAASPELAFTLSGAGVCVLVVAALVLWRPVAGSAPPPPTDGTRNGRVVELDRADGTGLTPQPRPAAPSGGA